MKQTLLDECACELLSAADSGSTLPTITGRFARFDEDAGYRVSRRLLTRREAAGWRPIGRKIGFTNRTIWARYGVFGPIWAPVYDRTVEFAIDDCASVSLAGLVQPRLEPEIAVRFASAPDAGGPEQLLAKLDWIAPSFELVHCHFPGWKFEAADTVADFGLHGRLVVGRPVRVGDHPAEFWLPALETAGVTLRRYGDVVDRGNAANVLGGPLHALGHLVRRLREQTEFPPIAAGEIVTTGTLTDAQPVAAGETWCSRYDGLPFAGITIAFEAA